uniref:Selenoprotein Klike [Xiphosphorus maculatus] n=1 Tax=Lepeophtheirus salmonis TaxID=72036 RepID=A0A0K2V8A7_LEPSM|nr:selenoprotein K-like [Lepeophtheirus salmonis]
MVYLTNDGQVHDSRPWSISSIKDTFWGFIQFFVLFFTTLFQPDSDPKGASSRYSTDYRNPGGRGPPPSGGPRRRMGGFSTQRSGPSPPPFSGGG